MQYTFRVQWHFCYTEKSIITFLPRCMECRRGLAMTILKLSVRLSVCQTRGYCDKTEERSVQIFMPYKGSFRLVL